MVIIVQKYVFTCKDILKINISSIPWKSQKKIEIFETCFALLLLSFDF